MRRVLDRIRGFPPELPRELPGLLVVFVSALLSFLRSRRLAAFAAFLGGAGLVLMAFLSFKVNFLILWLFIFSLGQHLFIPLGSSVGMELARDNRTGRRLGQLNAVRNAAVIAGSFFILIAFRFLHFNYQLSYLTAGLFYIVGAVFLLQMPPGEKHPRGERLKLHKEYGLFYWLNILFGTRKQIFLTFAPWVLVTVYNKPVAAVATLLTAGGLAGIVFQPLLGRAIDRLGERFVLAAEAVLLVLVCAGYGFSKFVLPGNIAFIIAAACFVADQLLMSAGMARSTYLKKIALRPSHVTPTLTMATSIDHFFSISVAVLGGVIWKFCGYQYVFLLGALIAAVNFFSVMRMKVPGGAGVPEVLKG